MNNLSTAAPSSRVISSAGDPEVGAAARAARTSGVKRVTVSAADDLSQRWVYVKDGTRGSATAYVAASERDARAPHAFVVTAMLADGRKKLIGSIAGTTVDLASEADAVQWVRDRATHLRRVQRTGFAVFPAAGTAFAVGAGLAIDSVVGTGLAWLLILGGAAITASVTVTAFADMSRRRKIITEMNELYGHAVDRRVMDERLRETIVLMENVVISAPLDRSL